LFRAIAKTLRLGIKSVFLHKLRSALTVLGILIGVTAVIWLVAMGEGVSRAAQRQIEELGATSIIVRSVKPPESGTRLANSFFLEYGLLRDDFERLKEIPQVERAVPIRELAQRDVYYEDRKLSTRVVGCTPEYMPVNRLEIERGRFLTAADDKRVDNVAVIGHETARILFPYEDPVGRTIQIDQEFYRVVGRTAERAESAGIGGSLAAQNYNLDVYIPLSTLRQRIGDRVMTSRSGSREGEIVQLSQITLQVGSIADVDGVEEQIQALLERYHPLPDYAIVVPKELLRQAEILRMLFTALLVLIAGISLIVGGIGIMNIMLATVTERTREIGIRRALGAKQSHIMWQFLTETLVLTLAGGLLGVLFGLLVGPIVGLARRIGEEFFPAVFATLPASIQEVEPVVAWWSILVSLAIAVLVGVFFGLYPAWQAAKMDPIEALRHE
jgi:putative ABC transport system permease protein